MSESLRSPTVTKSSVSGEEIWATLRTRVGTIHEQQKVKLTITVRKSTHYLSFLFSSKQCNNFFAGIGSKEETEKQFGASYQRVRFDFFFSLTANRNSRCNGSGRDVVMYLSVSSEDLFFNCFIETGSSRSSKATANP